MDESPATEHLRVVKRALQNERWIAAKKSAGRALADGLPAKALRPAFAAAGKLDLLASLLWRRRDEVLKDVGTVALFARIAAETNHADDYFAKLKHWKPTGVANQPTFCYRDILSAHKNVDKRVLSSLFRIKYSAWDAAFTGDVLRNAAQYTDSFHIPPETAEFFYNHRGDTRMNFPTWLRELKAAQMLHHIVSDASVVNRIQHDSDPQIARMAADFCRMASFREHINVDEARRLFEGLDRSNGLLVSIFHGGFFKISNYLYTTCMPDPYWLTTSTDGRPNVIKVPGNERAAAFRAYRALTEGKAVMIAGDGFHFGKSGGVTVEVLGLKTKISEGSAALAYESNCNTGWIAAHRRGDMFVPEYISGPRRASKESYKAFRDRWVSFYVEQVKGAFSSGPENLVLSARWGSPHSQFWS